MAGRSSRQFSDNSLLPFSNIAAKLMLFVIRPPCFFFLILAIPCACSPSSSTLFAEAPPWRASGGLTKVSGFLKVFWRPPGRVLEVLGASSGYPASNRGLPERPGHDLECFG
eukprot:7376837-Pyramimonas_sp.AAC.1